ncbi:MAG TPA: oligosaccharide flippase family protein, partial [Candidatus Binataceae bacterium]|nr:oligosaccharide flippase family protein [Candidatus Binataceae bacterium]
MNPPRDLINADSGPDERSGATPSPEQRDQDNEGAGRWSALWDAFVRGVRDNMMGEVVVQLVRVGGLIFLARALRPQDFGLLKVLAIVGTFGLLLSEAGIPEALIQRPELRREHEVTAWWSTLALSSSLVTALYFGAPLLASVMGMKDLVFGVRLLCIPLLLQGIAICAHARLRRELRFGAVAVANVFAEFMFLGVALVLLFEGL